MLGPTAEPHSVIVLLGDRTEASSATCNCHQKLSHLTMRTMIYRCVFTARQHSLLCLLYYPTSYSKSVRPSVRLSVCHTLAQCQYDVMTRVTITRSSLDDSRM